MRNLFLCPAFFYAGLSVVAGSILFLAYNGIFNVQPWEATVTRRQKASGCIAIGLLLMTISGEKEETKITSPREHAFFYTMCTVIFLIALELIIGSTYWSQNGYGLLIMALIVYLMLFNLSSKEH